jgi:hypothetical protein
MPSRLVFSIRFFNKTFFKLLKLSLAMIFFMTLFRMNLFFLSVFHALPNLDMNEVMQAFVAGLRFDVLIFGFLLSPIVLITLIQAFFEKWPRGLFVFYKIYLGLAWIIICALTFVDFFYFAKFGKRMRFAEYSDWSIRQTWDLIQGLQLNQSLIFSVITVMLLCLGLMLLRALQFGNWKDEYSPHKGSKLEITIRAIFPILAVVLAARGTVEAHHLALEHSQVSNTVSINEMALNSIWCFDK